jgi:hypothetical protein
LTVPVQIIKIKPSGFGPTADWLSLHGPKKVSKERAALAAGMTVRLIGGFTGCRDRECGSSLW